ncbi:uncharacterized protein HaLaN_01250 [Haematococcus lacustris]|uniref:Uncharacterized protein n=1 Tax=Haematococcus lacustris TaxID=44745 RepID=A0A699YB56_HAELA|nr:uncharacterized protein HaLaN_01250 [Haematococcus lacustris]
MASTTRNSAGVAVHKGDMLACCTLHGRCQERAPLQYLTASAHWRNHVLAVGPGVLIPRPETEIFPDLVSAAVAKRPGLALLPWADLGTGSGAIAIGTAEVLARTCKAPRVLAVDFSPIAVAYAHANAVAAGRSHHVQVMLGSWYEPIAQHLAGSLQAAADLGLQSGKLGGVLSNPPYIPSSVIQAGLQAEVGRHEPSTALDGGPGAGTDSLKVVCQGAVQWLAPGGFLALETAGGEQAAQVASLLGALPGADGPAFESVSVVPDCYQVPRFVTASRTAA